MLYVCIMDYRDDRSLLAEVRPRHRRYMRGLLEDGHAVLAGSFRPEDDGGMFFYTAASREAAAALIAMDPYVVEGVATRYSLREYRVHGAEFEGFRGAAEPSA